MMVGGFTILHHSSLFFIGGERGVCNDFKDLSKSVNDSVNYEEAQKSPYIYKKRENRKNKDIRLRIKDPTAGGEYQPLDFTDINADMKTGSNTKVY